MMEIRKIKSSNPEYAKLRELWCELFGDAPNYVDGLYDALDAEGYVGFAEVKGGVAETGGSKVLGANSASKIVTVLTIYDIGEFEGQTVTAIYAVCTVDEARGRGYASGLVEAALADIRAEGKLALTSPAEESLVTFYERLGFGVRLFVDEHRIELEEEEPMLELEGEMYSTEDFDEEEGVFVSSIGVSVEQISAERYGVLREEFLAECPHVKLNPKFLEFIKSESYEGNGMLLVNNGDAICVLADSDADETQLMELLVNPRLEALSSEIVESVAIGLAELFETKRVSYRTKVVQNGWAYTPFGCGADELGTKPSIRIQSLVSGNEALEGVYFGFALD